MRILKIKQFLKIILSDDMILKLKDIAAVKRNKKMLAKNKILQPFCKGHYPHGVNLIGDITAETGLGQSMRILASLMQYGDIPFCVKQVNLHGDLEHNDSTWEYKNVDNVKYAINIINLIPETWPADFCNLPQEVFDYRYNIAYWPWELEEFPERWVPCIETVNEIWTPSEFASRSVRKKTKKPVITVPHVVDIKEAEDKHGQEFQTGYYTREYFGLPEKKFLFLVMYDFISVSERKNPQAAIEAYKKAFPVEKEDVGMVIKVNHVEEAKLERLKKQLYEYKNIYFLTDNMRREEVNSLIKAVDVLVSLHRSEGFGLPLAEAMASGKPVISTNWSATTEFMDETCACLVDYKLIKLDKSIGPYEKGNYWADANVAHAAAYMERLWEDKGYRDQIGLCARKYLQEHLSYERVAGIIKERMREIEGQG